MPKCYSKQYYKTRNDLYMTTTSMKVQLVASSPRVCVHGKVFFLTMILILVNLALNCKSY